MKLRRCILSFRFGEEDPLGPSINSAMSLVCAATYASLACAGREPDRKRNQGNNSRRPTTPAILITSISQRSPLDQEEE